MNLHPGPEAQHAAHLPFRQAFTAVSFQCEGFQGCARQVWLLTLDYACDIIRNVQLHVHVPIISLGPRSLATCDSPAYSRTCQGRNLFVRRDWYFEKTGCRPVNGLNPQMPERGWQPWSGMPCRGAGGEVHPAAYRMNFIDCLPGERYSSE
jgi:hypothetical protein